MPEGVGYAGQGEEEEKEDSETNVVIEATGDVEELDIKSDDLEAIAVLYDQIRAI